MKKNPATRPLLIAMALGIVRLAAWLVPKRDREAWRHEWRAEILHGHAALARDHRSTFGSQAVIGRRALGALVDAAWLRRQFTTDSELVHDVRYAIRFYRRSPGIASLVVTVLAVGIGSTAAVFSAVDTILLSPVPFADAERVVLLWQRSNDTAKSDVAPANFLDWRDRLSRFDIVAAAEPYSRDYTSGAEPEIFTGARVTEGFFDALRTEPQQGRVLNADDSCTEAVSP